MAPEADRRPSGTLLIFWDYDTQWGADRSRCGPAPQSWGPLEFENTDTLLALHAEYEIPACFAVVGAAALPGRRPYHDPDQVRRIHAAGHEIASHSFRHEWLPGLTGARLTEELQSSKKALEDCIGAPVATFVPPYNQPFDYPEGWSFSLSERRSAGRRRTGLRRLCEELGQAGYRYCRVAHRPLPCRFAEFVLRRELLPLLKGLEKIGPLNCVRLNTPCGFAGPTLQALAACAKRGGMVAAYGHPHSLFSGNTQDVRFLRPFLETAAHLKRRGRLEICTPNQMTVH